MKLFKLTHKNEERYVAAVDMLAVLKDYSYVRKIEFISDLVIVA